MALSPRLQDGETPRFDSRAVRLWCGLLVAFYVSFFWIEWVGIAFRQGDFSMLWAAGRLAATGNAASAYNWAAIKALQPFAATVQGFYYPPLIFLLLAPFGALPYATAAALWVCVSLVAYLAAMRAILPGATAMIAALAAPPVLIVLASGQSGLLLAALLGGGLALLDTRPIAAGILIGMMAYKPHYGVLLPFFFAVTGRWRSFAAAACTVVVLAVAAGLVFGWSAYAAFAGFLGAAFGAYAQHNGMPYGMDWIELPSVYGTLRTLGVGAAIAIVAHIAAAASAAAAALWLATRRNAGDLALAGLAAAILLVSPYSERADWNLLTIAMAFLARDGLRHGMRPWEIATLAVVFALPLANLAAVPVLRFGGPGTPAWWFVGPIMGIVLLLLSLRRALRQPRPAAAGEPGWPPVTGVSEPS